MEMKKLTTLALCLLAVLTVAAQTTFTVKGTAHATAKSLQMGDMTGKTQPQTIQVENGQFTTTISNVPEQTFMTIVDRDNRMQSFFIVDGTEVNVDMNTDILTGSPLNAKLSDLMQQLSTVETEKAMQTVMRKAIDENKDNVIGAFALSQLMYFMSYEELKAELESGAPYLQHPLCDQAKQQLKSLELRAPGTMFKDIVENDTTGVSHHLSEYVGKGDYVLVDFWASWCGPCMQEMPNVKANYEKYKDKGFKVVGLSFDRNADAWKKAIREHYLNWIHLSDLKFWQTVAAETYGIRSIPSSILCDPTGKIVDIDLRGEKLGAKLMEIYGE